MEFTLYFLYQKNSENSDPTIYICMFILIFAWYTYYFAEYEHLAVLEGVWTDLDRP